MMNKESKDNKTINGAVLSIKGLTAKIKGKVLVEDISLDAYQNEILMIVGPNGAGKSSLIKAVMGTIPHTGSAYINGDDIKDMKPQMLAKKIGVLTQYNNLAYSFSVEEVVKMGRYSHVKDFFGRLTKQDDEMVENALELTGISHIRNQCVLTLSGGELQRVFLAQLFAQDPQVLILDEPTNHLDLQYQIHIFDIIKQWIKQGDRTVIAVVHDLNLALHYGEKAILLKDGKKVQYGDIKEVLSKENLENVYNVDVFGHMNKMLDNWNW